MLWGWCCGDLARATWGGIHPEPDRRDYLPGVEIYFDERYWSQNYRGVGLKNCVLITCATVEPKRSAKRSRRSSLTV